jgi:PAS domain S-box-containing protein
VKRFAGGTRAFSRPADFLRFCLFAGGLATAVSAFAGATVLATTGAYGNFQFFSTFIAWWTGDALGVLVVAPFLVLLLNGTHHPLHLRELGEMLILLIGLSVVCVISFGPNSLLVDDRTTLVMLCIPFLVWAAIRFCPLEASGACMLLCGFATWGSLHGYGPFANNSSLVLPLAAYLSVATAMTLAGAAAVASQREISEQLLESLCRLEQLKDFEISRLTSELEFFRDELTRRVHAKSRREAAARELQRPETQPNPNPHDVVWFLDAETENILYVSPAYEAISGRSIADLKRDPHAWLDTVHPEDREFAMLFVGNEFPGDRLETTYRVLRPDGSIRWIFDRGFVVRDLSGKAVRFIGVATDITEQVQQGEVVPLQLGHRHTVNLREGEAGTHIRRKQE